MSYNELFDVPQAWSDSNDPSSPSGTKYDIMVGLHVGYFREGAYGAGWSSFVESTELPTAPQKGRYFLRHNTTNGEMRLYAWNGSTWKFSSLDTGTFKDDIIIQDNSSAYAKMLIGFTTVTDATDWRLGWAPRNTADNNWDYGKEFGWDQAAQHWYFEETLNLVRLSANGSLGSAGQILYTDGAGNISWQNVPAGDNLGNHTATQALHMETYGIKMKRADLSETEVLAVRTNHGIADVLNIGSKDSVVNEIHINLGSDGTEDFKIFDGADEAVLHYDQSQDRWIIPPSQQLFVGLSSTDTELVVFRQALAANTIPMNRIANTSAGSNSFTRWQALSAVSSWRYADIGVDPDLDALVLGYGTTGSDLPFSDGYGVQIYNSAFTKINASSFTSRNATTDTGYQLGLNMPTVSTGSAYGGWYIHGKYSTQDQYFFESLILSGTADTNALMTWGWNISGTDTTYFSLDRAGNLIFDTSINKIRSHAYINFDGLSVPPNPGVTAEVNVGSSGGQSFRVQSVYGQTDIGPVNGSWSHFLTDRVSYYFDKQVSINGLLNFYTRDWDLEVLTGNKTQLFAHQDTTHAQFTILAGSAYDSLVRFDQGASTSSTTLTGAVGWDESASAIKLNYGAISNDHLWINSAGEVGFGIMSTWGSGSSYDNMIRADPSLNSRAQIGESDLIGGCNIWDEDSEAGVIGDNSVTAAFVKMSAYSMYDTNGILSSYSGLQKIVELETQHNKKFYKGTEYAPVGHRIANLTTMVYKMQRKIKKLERKINIQKKQLEEVHA